MKYGIQLYSINKRFNENQDEALKNLAEIGFDYVEFCTFADRSAEEIKEMLDKYNLKTIGAHLPIEMLADDKIESTIEYQKAIGNDKFILPIIHLPVKDAIEAVNRAQPILEASGISLHLHNHGGEFERDENGVTPLENYIKYTDLNFEVDILFASISACDPLELIKRLGKRVSLVHMKDGRAAAPYHPTLFGEGELDLPGIHKYASENGITMITEHSPTTPDVYGEHKACLDYLKSLEK